jgi:hypothetical protein
VRTNYSGVAVSNPARGMDVCLLCLYVVLSCVGRGLCDGLITRPEEPYRVSNCVIKKPQCVVEANLSSEETPNKKYFVLDIIKGNLLKPRY